MFWNPIPIPPLSVGNLLSMAALLFDNWILAKIHLVPFLAFFGILQHLFGGVRVERFFCVLWHCCGVLWHLQSFRRPLSLVWRFLLHLYGVFLAYLWRHSGICMASSGVVWHPLMLYGILGHLYGVLSHLHGVLWHLCGVLWYLYGVLWYLFDVLLHYMASSSICTSSSGICMSSSDF